MDHFGNAMNDNYPVHLSIIQFKRLVTKAHGLCVHHNQFLMLILKTSDYDIKNEILMQKARGPLVSLKIDMFYR